MLPGVEVSHPKTINIKQYLSTDNFSVNNRHVVIKSSQETQLYITKVFYKQFSCHHHIKHNFCNKSRDTSTPGSIEGPQRCDRDVTGSRGITIHSEQRGN
jgi:mRNA-degrading endonuclease HigB of HigAB toxin-antitoxin module